MTLLILLSAMAHAAAPSSIIAGCVVAAHDPGAMYTLTAEIDGVPVTTQTPSVFVFAQSVATLYPGNTLQVTGNAPAHSEYVNFTECLSLAGVVLESSLWANANGFPVRQEAATWSVGGSVLPMVVDGHREEDDRHFIRLVDPVAVAAGLCQLYLLPAWAYGSDLAVNAAEPADPTDHPGHSCTGDPCSSCDMFFLPIAPGGAKKVSCGCTWGQGNPPGTIGFCNHGVEGGPTVPTGPAEPLLEL